jgi:hypothetical protein
MTNKKKTQSYLCSSAEWDCLVEDAESPFEAAAKALKQQVDSPSTGFTVGATIKVMPVKFNIEKAQMIYSPIVLADIGMHAFAKDLDELLKAQEDEDENEDS